MSRCVGLRMRLLSPWTTALGTCSATDRPPASQRSPIPRVVVLEPVSHPGGNSPGKKLLTEYAVKKLADELLHLATAGFSGSVAERCFVAQ